MLSISCDPQRCVMCYYGRQCGDACILSPDERIIESGECTDFKLILEHCPICSKEVYPSTMIMTKDCHGVPFRKVCASCYDGIIHGRGYDGEYYQE